MSFAAFTRTPAMRDAEVPQVVAVLPEGVRDHEGEVVHNPAHERQYSFAGPAYWSPGSFCMRVIKASQTCRSPFCATYPRTRNERLSAPASPLKNERTVQIPQRKGAGRKT